MEQIVQRLRELRQTIVQIPVLRPIITLLDDEVVVGATITVLSAYFVAYVDIVYAELFVVLIIFFGMALFGLPTGRAYIGKNARVIGKAVQLGIDQFEAKTGYDIPDPVEDAFVNAVITELEKRGQIIEPPGARG